MAAVPGAQGFDTDTGLVAASAGQLFATGFQFAGPLICLVRHRRASAISAAPRLKRFLAPGWR